MASRILPLVVLAAAFISRALAADITVKVSDAAGHPLPEAVVYLRGAGVAAVGAPAQVTIDQKNKQFAPQISVVSVGTAVAFPNSDQIRHSVYSFSPAKPFTIKLYAGKPPAPVVFDHEGIVVLGCNIHDAMAAWVAVVDTPLFGKTDSSGVLVLHGVRPASYELAAWYPGMESGPQTQTMAVTGVDAVSREVRLPVSPLGNAGQ